MVTKPYRAFSIDMQTFAKKTGLTPGIVLRKTALDILTKVVMRTPVDTGRARNSWMVQDGSPDYTIPAAGSYDQSGADSINRGMKISGSTGKIVITNNLPYIVALEFGHSKQAPMGMARISVAEVITEMKTILMRLK